MLRKLPLVLVSLALLALTVAPAPAGATVAPGDPDDPVVVVVGDVVVPRGEAVEGVYLMSGDARIAGRVDGDVIVLSGDVVLSGQVSGDLFTASGTARLLPGAEVEGDVTYSDHHPNVSFDAIVGGDVKEESLPDLGGALPLLGGFLIWLAFGVSQVLLGLLLILIAPRAADAVHARSRERVGPTIGIGVAIAIVLPVVAVVAAITVLGLPLAFILLLALLPLWSIAYLASAWALGRRLVGPPRQRPLSFLAGLGIFWAIGLVPIVGALFTLVATVFGLGLIGASIGAARDPKPKTGPTPPPPPPPPGPAQNPGS